MTDKDMVFRLRKQIFEEWRWKRLTWQEVKQKYGFSKRWFYKFRKRYIRDGDRGLRDLPRKKPLMPHALTWEQKIRILDYVYDNPTHGPEQIAFAQEPRLSAKGVWNYLKQEDLNTRHKRRRWAHYQGKPVLSKKELCCWNARYRHVQSTAPGELVSIDTFQASVAKLGRIWQYTACDTFSSYGWAKIYATRNSDITVEFLENHILKNVPEGKIKRILSDQGSEFYSARHRQCMKEFYKNHNIKHTVTKIAHPRTNGYAERLNQTIWQEFYLCRLTHPYSSLEELQDDLDKFMTEYNWKRRHTGYKLKSEGLQFPGHAFFDLRENQDIVEIKY